MTLEVVSFGCRLNAAEGEAIRALAAGLEGTVVVNSCAVTGAAEAEARRLVARLHRERPEAAIIVTGCAAQIDPAGWAAQPGVARVLGNAEKLDPAFWAPGAPGRVGPIAALSTHAPAAPARMAGRTRAFLDVQQGCDHSCTFCIIPAGRGRGRSVPPEQAAARVRAMLRAGCHEVVLTGIDLASWGRDLADRPGLDRLVRHLLREVPGLGRLRLSSLDPAALDEGMLGVLADEPRLMPHLHLSLQSGADLVLKRMRRRHRADEALALIARARAARPLLAVGADLIAGFPTETEAMFAESLALVREAAIPYLHVFPYSPRPGTPAARMPQVPPAERRARAAALRDAARPHAARFHAGLLGRSLPILAERDGRGHTEHFAPVRLRDRPPAGALVRRTILAADADGLEAG